MMKSIILFIFLTATSYCFGQQLVYTPINPSFGGDTFNYTWLLNSANSQNPFKDENQFGGLDRLDRLTSGLGGGFGGKYGNDELPPMGVSSAGDFQYEVFDSEGGLVINILNVVTGEASQIIVPN